jgi:hypothetical protein
MRRAVFVGTLGSLSILILFSRSNLPDDELMYSYRLVIHFAWYARNGSALGPGARDPVPVLSPM